jgi:hypothetical protein
MYTMTSPDLNRTDYVDFFNQYPNQSLIRLGVLLGNLWLRTYCRRHGAGSADIIRVTIPTETSRITYLFDIPRERIVVVWGLPIYAQHTRDRGRQQEHREGWNETIGSQYDVGHLIAHTLGGGQDINVVPQLRNINRGKFQQIEKAVRELTKTGGRCLYFVRTIYAIQAGVSPQRTTQMPSWIEQAYLTSPSHFAYDVQANK